jgi:subtilisin family serine protease
LKLKFGAANFRVPNRTQEPFMKSLAIALLLANTLAASPFVKDQLIIRVKENPLELLKAYPGLELDRVLVPSLDIYRVKLEGGWTVDDAVEVLSQEAALVWVQADHLTSGRLTPDDVEFPQQWALDQASDADIDAPEAWDLGTGGSHPDGSTIVAAIVDGGCEISHPDLADNIWTNQGEIAGNFQDDDGNGYVDDVNGWDAYADDGTLPSDYHGTHVTGIVGARGNNLNQVCGINWDVDLMTVAGSSSSTSVVSIAYNYVLENKQLWLDTGGAEGANIVVTNSSFGIDFADCTSGTYPIWNDLYDAMGAVGILSCAATMNRNSDVDQTGDVPTGCTSDWLIAVTNTTSTDLRNSGAAYGLNSIDLGAPGTQVRSTYTGGGTTNLTGTSMASPQVAGAVAFLHSVMSPALFAHYQQDPGVAVLELKQILLDTVDPLAALDGLCVSGGRLNLYQAALAASTWGGGGLQPELTISLLPSHEVLLEWNAVTGATLYHVETRQSLNDAWLRIASIDSTSHVEAAAWEGQGIYRVIAELP